MAIDRSDWLIVAAFAPSFIEYGEDGEGMHTNEEDDDLCCLVATLRVWDLTEDLVPQMAANQPTA